MIKSYVAKLLGDIGALGGVPEDSELMTRFFDSYWTSFDWLMAVKKMSEEQASYIAFKDELEDVIDELEDLRRRIRTS